MTTMINQEAIYDQQIAPLLTQIIEICKQHEIDCVSSFYLLQRDEEQEDELVTVKTCLLYKKHPSAKLAAHLQSAGDNLDLFLIKVAKDSSIDKSGSILSRLP